MNFAQLIPFDMAKGGNTPNLCLANVCKGYGIANKYGSAWEAWENTQQHPDRNIPDGLDVPLYYSYTTTLDGVTKNYGHINVRLKNGTVWSDGNIYASIDDYLSKKLPKFVGWGESINDVKVIKQGDVMDKEDAKDVYGYTQHIDRPDESQWGPWVGKQPKELVSAIINSPTWNEQNYILKVAYPALQKELEATGSDKAKQILADVQNIVNKYKEQS